MTDKIRSVDLKMTPRSIIGYRLMARYRHLPYDEYIGSVNFGLELLKDLPESLMQTLLDSGFLEVKAKDN